MTTTTEMPKPTQISSFGKRIARLGAATASLLALALVLAATASASYEEISEFGDTGPIGEGGSAQAQLHKTNGAAVNYTGAGAVAPGTLYVARPQFTAFGAGGGNFNGLRVYDSRGEFLEEWGDVSEAFGVAVDQATGDVYVLRNLDEARTGVVQVYKPDGTLIGEFGETGNTSETIAEGPEKIHAAQRSGISVDEAGTVYVSDSGNGFSRVMVFEPESAGDYAHYAYAGHSHDIAYTAVGEQVEYGPTALALDAAGDLYMGAPADSSGIFEFDPSEPNAPICTYEVPGGAQLGTTVDPLTGEVFYWTEKHRTEILQLNPCNGEGKFTPKDKITLQRRAEEVYALAFDPTLSYDPGRPAGILYGFSSVPEAPPSFGIDQMHAYGIIAAPAVVHPPVVESESVSSVGSTNATLHAQIDPQGSPTRYAFQYETEAQYQANHADETQSLTLSASSGLFGLAYEGRRFGGPLTADLTSGSTAATALSTAEGTATLKAAEGTATLKAAKGTGTVIAGSSTITSLATSEGSFEANQLISGNGIPVGTKVVTVGAGELTISNPATASKANAELSAGSTTLSSLATAEGAFEVGQVIEGTGIPANTTILTVSPSELTISKAPSKPGSGVAIVAGSTNLTALATTEGAFEAGQRIEGEGIAPETKIESASSSELVLSKPVTKPGVAVPIHAAGVAPLAPGQAIEGPGIAPGTTIEAVKAGELILSAPAEASAGGAHLSAGLPYDASAAEVRAALESLPAIGSGNLRVTGGPGDEAGSSPYEIAFTGTLADTDVEPLSASSLSLSGGAASALVATENNGGGGFAGASEAPAGGGELGSGSDALSALATLEDLSPETEYRFRALATSHCNPDQEESLCEDTGTTGSFRTFPAEGPGLPDRRAWEMVSPPRKEGGEVWPADATVFSKGCPFCKPGAGQQHFPMQSAPAGEAVIYQGYPFSNNEGSARSNQYIARRTSSGWRTTNLTPPFLDVSNSGFNAFDEELNAGVLKQAGDPTLSAAAPAGYPNLYAQQTAEPSTFSPLLTKAPPNRTGVEEFSVEFLGASADFSKLFFAANDALTSETPFAPAAEDPGRIARNLYESADGQLSLVNVLPGNATSAPGAVLGSGKQLGSGGGNVTQPVYTNAISEDGNRIFWSDESGQLYVREDGQLTREIPDHVGKFLTASRNGSKVLLSDGFLYDLEVESGIDLTEGQGGFRGIAGQSEDLSHIYFVDTAVLGGEEENEHGAKAQQGGDNLYAWHEGGATFVTTLSAGDAGSELSGTWQAAPAIRTAEASPDGRWLAFLSVTPASGQDNTGLCEETSSGSGKFVPGTCAEAFVYDSATGTLSCASCNPAGLAPLGPSSLELIEGEQAPAPQPRYMLDSGRLYFDSQDSLSPFDTNEGVEDVYQWEPKGAGSCESQFVGGGCVNLISAGHEPVDSNLLAVDETGKNVFFTTRDQLVLQDSDDLLDLYDAREDGGIPAESETSRGECQGEACQPQAVAPNDPTPGSSTFEGAGNVHEKVKQKKHHKHHKKPRHHRAHKRAPNHDRGGAK
jgi:hypothetical protein